MRLRTTEEGARLGRTALIVVRVASCDPPASLVSSDSRPVPTSGVPSPEGSRTALTTEPPASTGTGESTDTPREIITSVEHALYNCPDAEPSKFELAIKHLHDASRWARHCSESDKAATLARDLSASLSKAAVALRDHYESRLHLGFDVHVLQVQEVALPAEQSLDLQPELLLPDGLEIIASSAPRQAGRPVPWEVAPRLGRLFVRQGEHDSSEPDDWIRLVGDGALANARDGVAVVLRPGKLPPQPVNQLEAPDVAGFVSVRCMTPLAADVVNDLVHPTRTFALCVTAVFAAFELAKARRDADLEIVRLRSAIQKKNLRLEEYDRREKARLWTKLWRSFDFDKTPREDDDA